ncbi:tautomerase family protein [Pendulispora brunnea]|uniref:Tautomerase family protein n=1 Tax=Pendulispora brunnea TaxID=2905690 RepID=A0ABZ2JZD0_9BACT
MPLVRFDLIQGRTDEEVQTLLDAAHRALVDAFGVPERDRYQIVHEHPASRLILQDTGLGIARTNKVVVLTLVTRPRSEGSKTRFYQALCRELEENCGIAPSDVIVSMVTNSDSDWSFGNGRAQFMTGELSPPR